jgi:hypothetical protein
MLKLIGLGIALALGLLRTPVLAVIPETLTRSQRSRRRVLWGLRWLGLALLLGAMIPVFVMVIDRAQIFQILANR